MDHLKLKLTVAYDGTHYKGWQVQKNGVTVQQRIEEALRRLFPSVKRIHRSSRTDTGVHARGMVANVNHPSLGIIKQVVSSIVTDGSNQALGPGPALGENTDDLLSDLLSMNRDQIKKLRDQGAVG